MPTLDSHPLTALLAQEHTTAIAYLTRVAGRHRALGFGQFGVRKEKLSRWKKSAPEIHAQLAMADLHGIDPEEIYLHPWPDWLRLALRTEANFWDLPWTVAGTVEALEDAGGLMDRPGVDRRSLVIAALGTLAATGAHWAAAPPTHAAVLRGPRIGPEAADLFEDRLKTLRSMDDTLGSSHAYQAATAELELITRVLKKHTYSETTQSRLYAAAAETARLAGWCAYDSGHLAIAERRFATALRASATSGDPTTGASAIAFWANLRYAAGDPYGALGLVDRGLQKKQEINSPRVVTMLHARKARAHSKAGEAAKAYRAIDAAFDAYAHAGPAEHDLPSMYWMTHGEVHEVAASCALTLGDPQRALEHFDAALHHEDPYDTTAEARGAGIYLARQAEAHLALGDLDAALDVAGQALDRLGGADSARGDSTITDLRRQLARHHKSKAVADFLELTA